ncbi:PREDICTED: endo-1 4-beta-xylanase [Prunus dulcis]|uniref:PREDICTED: endo-1 4-beta-xylanase n=1 Tax=Prunus dulcis TaxID=3755 RepID=A0A5E4FRK6_PRUDU|nr:PREDICTED: endo-1 4-beta-xylanase [Prunus dulcis]
MLIWPAKPCLHEIYFRHVRCNRISNMAHRSGCAKRPKPGPYLEEILREGFSHPAVEGIMMFVDKSFKNTPAGDVVDKLLDEWKFGTQETTTDDEGFTNISVFHRDYEITVQNHITNSSATLNLRVTQDEPQTIVQVNDDT